MARQMKDSGVEWIGEIPENWENAKMKQIGQYINGYAFKPDDWTDKGKPIIRIQDLTKSNNKPNYYSGSIDEKYNVTKGNILVSWAATLDAFIWNKEDGWLNQHIFKVVPNTDLIEKDFCFWLMKVAMENMNNDNKHGIVMQHVTTKIFGDFSIPLPPMLEQQKIADFLDEKVGEIDSVIAKTKETIEDYKKYKQAIITDAVTKGLNPDVEMKESKSSYLGTVPVHWVEKRLRFLGLCQNGISKSSEYFGEGYPFVSYGDVYKNYALPKRGSGLIKSSEEDRKIYSVQYGDVFFTRTSETIEEVGFTSTCLNTIEDATFAGFVIRFRPNNQEELLPEFSKYYFRSEVHRKFFVKEMNLVTRASLSQELLKKLPILLPPLEEQRKIAEYLDEKCFEIDKLIAKKEELLVDLENYKKSLIYEYVTGKKEVE